MLRPIWSDWTCFGLMHSACCNVCSNKDLGIDVGREQILISGAFSALLRTKEAYRK